jgi:hypothetical protein
MSQIVIPADEDCGDWHAEARFQVEIDGTLSLVLVREWRSDGVEPHAFSEQAELPQSYRQ